jgi:hypothetical protein
VNTNRILNPEGTITTRPESRIGYLPNLTSLSRDRVMGGVCRYNQARSNGRSSFHRNAHQ